MEWWDAGLLQNRVYEMVDDDISNLREERITIYVEHPVPLEPPAEEIQPPPMPLPLTQKVSYSFAQQNELEIWFRPSLLCRSNLAVSVHHLYIFDRLTMSF